MQESILAIDIGGGTQDILLYEEGKPMENCVQMILPSPTRIVARQISRATAQKRDLFLAGNTMGGGPSSGAVHEHLKAGLKVYATEEAALTLQDNLDELQEMGVRLTRRQPGGTKRIRMGDVDLAALRRALSPFGVPLPQTCAVAVQDHGFNPQGSNRRFRFRYWRRFLGSGGRLVNLIYDQPPAYMTRMIAVQKDAPGAWVMDTCAAAVWGMLCDPQVASHTEEGLLALNLGNQHTLGALVQKDRIWGIFEHHTGLLTPPKLKKMVDRFMRNALSDREIFADGGHGCAFHAAYPAKKKALFVAVTGPRRALAEGMGYYPAAPYGDMMLTGCFGLVAALKAKTDAPQRHRDHGAIFHRRKKNAELY